jgi:hypothetical protein
MTTLLHIQEIHTQIFRVAHLKARSAAHFSASFRKMCLSTGLEMMSASMSPVIYHI